jgi:hypothetical protein
VIARKKGSSAAVEARTLSTVLRCSRCGQAEWKKEAGHPICQSCGKELSITREGIVLC